MLMSCIYKDKHALGHILRTISARSHDLQFMVIWLVDKENRAIILFNNITGIKAPELDGAFQAGFDPKCRIVSRWPVSSPETLYLRNSTIMVFIVPQGLLLELGALFFSPETAATLGVVSVLFGPEMASISNVFHDIINHNTGSGMCRHCNVVWVESLPHTGLFDWLTWQEITSHDNCASLLVSHDGIMLPIKAPQRPVVITQLLIFLMSLSMFVRRNRCTKLAVWLIYGKAEADGQRHHSLHIPFWLSYQASHEYSKYM